MISYPFVTLSELKVFLDIPETITKLDTRLSLLLSTATSQIEEETGRTFTRQIITEFFTSRDNRITDYDFGSNGISYSSNMSSGLATRIKPQTFYLQGIGIDRGADFRVWYDPYVGGDTPYSDSTLLTPNQDYQIDFENDALILRIGTGYYQRALKVAYTAGYAFAPADMSEPNDNISLSAAIPDTLRLAAMVQAQYLNVKLRADNVGMGSERTVSAKDRVSSSPFLSNSRLTSEVVGIVRDLKRLRLGTN